MTQQCFNPSRQYVFNCTPAFIGYILENTVNASTSQDDFDYINNDMGGWSLLGVAFAADPQLTEAGGRTWLEENGGPNSHLGSNVAQLYPTNALYYGAWAIGYPAARYGDYDPAHQAPFAGDHGINYDPDLLGRGGTWMLNCSMTVWDIRYTWVNGKVQTFDMTLASADMGGMLSGPIAMGFAQDAIVSAALTASYSENSSQAIANSLARELSRAMLAYSLRALEPRMNECEQLRELKNVARILLEPSVKGLTAAHFNQPKLLQENVVTPDLEQTGRRERQQLAAARRKSFNEGFVTRSDGACSGHAAYAEREGGGFAYC